MKPRAASDSKGSQKSMPGQNRRKSDPLQELDQPLDENDAELLDDGELDCVGDLGNEKDKKLDCDALLTELANRPSTSASNFIGRATDCIRALRGLRSEPASPWTANRVPEEHWRALADEALGLIGGAVRREIDARDLVESVGEDDRVGLQGLLDSKLGMDMFRKAFEQERSAWEKAYWLMALDQSFGKKPWTGPTGWRALLHSRRQRRAARV